MDPLICSAKGCRAPAVWALAWNNPKLHGPERRKTWLACDQHRGTLSDFLAARGFLRETAAMPTTAATNPVPSATPAQPPARGDGRDHEDP